MNFDQFKINKNILFVLLLLLLFNFAYTQTTGKISGRVVDISTEEALLGVNVILEGTNLGAATDLNGHFYILNISPGKYAPVITNDKPKELQLFQFGLTPYFPLPELGLTMNKTLVQNLMSANY